jgi:3-oxoadipate enol-lactonase
MVAAGAATPDPEQLAGMRRQLAARAGHDVVADLSSIAQPTLVCAGRYDDIAPMENSQLLAERIPNATLQVFEGGHIFMVQDRSAFPSIIAFLEGAS